jgi:uncharacterized membrane protein
MLYIMAVLYFAAGMNHFLNPLMYKKIVPVVLPNKDLIVMITGICEILFALLLIPVFTRVFAAWAIIVFLVAVFPANIQMVLNYYHKSSPRLWLSILRLPLQWMLIYWAHHYTKPVD